MVKITMLALTLMSFNAFAYKISSHCPNGKPISLRPENGADSIGMQEAWNANRDKFCAKGGGDFYYPKDTQNSSGAIRGSVGTKLKKLNSKN